MRSFVLLSVLSAALFSLSGCGASNKVEETAKTYQCPSCKQTVTWMYNSKGLPTGSKQVTHNCPGCKREWGANLTLANACSMCVDQHLKCPLCQQHSR